MEEPNEDSSLTFPAADDDEVKFNLGDPDSGTATPTSQTTPVKKTRITHKKILAKR